MHVLAGEVVGVFAHVERADQDRACGLHARDQRGVACGRRTVAVDLGACTGRQPLDIEQVLHGERHASERADRFAGRDRRVDLSRLGACALGRDIGEGVQHAIARSDPRQRGLSRLLGGELAGGHRGGDGARGHVGRIKR